jgi:type IV pilus assembly protein PilC
MMRVPLLGSLVRTAALAEYANALGALYSAGIPVREALHGAAGATRNMVFTDAGRRVAGRVDAGERLHEAFSAESATFPRILIEAVKVGETSGKLDETLSRVQRIASEEASARLRRLAAALPVVIYLIVAAFIGYTVITAYSQIFSAIK